MYASVKVSQINRLNKQYHRIVTQFRDPKVATNPRTFATLLEEAEYMAQSIRRLAGE